MDSHTGSGLLFDNRHMHSKPCNYKVENLSSQQAAQFPLPRVENNLGRDYRIFWLLFLRDHQDLKDVYFLCQSACQLLRLSITEFFFEMLGILFQTQIICLGNSLDVDVTPLRLTGELNHFLFTMLTAKLQASHSVNQFICFLLNRTNFCFRPFKQQPVHSLSLFLHIPESSESIYMKNKMTQDVAGISGNIKQ